ncbi:MAG TPA: secretin and TonB N-terminal domain-containing protein, partial [Rhizomicrobium sp.]
MIKSNYLKAAMLSLCAIALATGAMAEQFNIPAGDLKNVLNAYTAQTGFSLMVSDSAIKGVRSRGVKGDLSADEALTRILAGSGFIVRNDAGVIAVVRGRQQSSDALDDQSIARVAAATAPVASGTSLETVTVTSSKIGGDVQNIPISITALSQEQLTATQTAGGPDLVKQVPNMTFTKTNFSGYSIQL